MMDPKAYKTYSLDELYAFLKRFNLAMSLHQIGCFNEILKFGHRTLKDGNDQPQVRAYLEKLSDIDRLSFRLISTRLARFLMLSGANDYRDPVLNIQDGSLQDALNRTGQMSEKMVRLSFENDYDPLVLLGRESQWQFPLQVFEKYTIGRGYLLFDKLLYTVENEYDINKKMHDYFGIGSYEFLVNGFIFWIKSDGLINGDIMTDTGEIQDIISPTNQQRFIELSSGSYRQYRECFRGQNWKRNNKIAEIYGLDPLTWMPIIIPDNGRLLPSKTYIIPQPHNLIERTFSGIFYLLADKEKHLANEANQKRKNSFRTMFGKLYREYAKIHLSLSRTNINCIDLDKDFTQKKGMPIPDFALISETTCLLIEIKTSLLSLDSRTYFDMDQLEEEVKNGSLKKAITQLHRFKEKILYKKLDDDRFKGIDDVYIVIIGYEEVHVLNSILLSLMKKHYGESITNGLQLGSISDLECMGTILQEGGDLVKLMKEKYHDPERSYFSISVAFDNLKKVENKVLKKSYAEYINGLLNKFPGYKSIHQQ